MTLERSELTVKEGVEEDFVALMRGEAGALLLKGAGCLSVRAGRGVENPGKIILLVEWESIPAHQAYTKTPEYTEFRALIAPFVTGGAMEHFEMA